MNEYSPHMIDDTPYKYHIDVGHYQYNHELESICGDVFLSKRVPDENRVVCVLSDGMGHGVRANILGTLTATISLNLTLEHKEASSIAGILMKALPVCSERGLSYSTYTIIDISISDDRVFMLEFDNPQTFIMRGNRIYEPEWKPVSYEGHVSDKRGLKLRSSTFVPQIEDRIIFCSDGIIQSGMGKGMTMGWGRNNMIQYVRETLESHPTLAANELARYVVKQAATNDLQSPKDDMTCGVIYFREPRKTILCTGPPFNMNKDREFALVLKNFEGRKIISGATTTEIIARELNREVVDESIVDPTLPPSSRMEGVDLVTEGVLTLSKVTYILNNLNNSQAQSNIPFGKGPADQICKILLDSDEIYILVGTKINESHHDPTLPVELEIRKNLVKRLASVLGDKFLKVVDIRYM